MDKIISNIEGLRNPTILQQLEAMRKYILENAKQGARGVQGIFTVDAAYNADTLYYPIAAVRNYVAESFVGQTVYFNNGYTAIVEKIYQSTPVASPAFTVSNVKDLQGASIIRVENTGYSDGDGFTITHCEAELSNGQTEAFDVHAKIGPQGPQGPQGEVGPQGPQGEVGPQGPQGPSTITVDDMLSLSSENPVQNKTITTAINTVSEKQRLFYHTINFTLYMVTKDAAPYRTRQQVIQAFDSPTMTMGSTKHRYQGQLRFVTHMNYVPQTDSLNFQFIGTDGFLTETLAEEISDTVTEITT